MSLLFLVSLLIRLIVPLAPTENILLDENKNIKIIDFGLSNLYDNEKLLETFCGSPKYAAPEIITGVKYLGPSVDIWSIGVILFASLCGKLPFNGSTIEKTYARVLQGVINYPPHLTPGTYGPIIAHRQRVWHAHIVLTPAPALSCCQHNVEAKDLIGRILQVDLTKRATMEEIMQHEWVRRDFPTPINSYLPVRPLTVENPDSSAVEHLTKFGYTAAESTSRSEREQGGWDGLAAGMGGTGRNHPNPLPDRTPSFNATHPP